MTDDPERAAVERQDPRLGRAPGGRFKAVRIWLLGGFRVCVGSGSIGEEEWRLRKAGTLVKLLALAPGHRLHREQAMELLWPELDSEAAANNLHYALHVARRTLEPASTNSASEYLSLWDDLLALCPSGTTLLWVDVEAFEEAAATARHDAEPAAYRAAVDLYAGELLPRDRYEPWVEERRKELRRAYLSLLIELAGLCEGRGEFGEAIEALGRAVAEEPAHEEAHMGLMRLYALLGRRREALGQYEWLREALFREFGAEPEAPAKRLREEIRAGNFPPADPPGPAEGGDFLPEEPSPEGAAGRHNLPLARTSFVGRESEVLEVKRLLAMTRLLTLTGAGGSGKTRLALEVAGELAGAYPDGAWLVELASLSEGELMPRAVASALGISEQPGRPLLDTLVDALRASKMLLVLDNCEHLIDAAAHLADALLSACPKLRILATSREPLGVGDETVWVVPPLSLPDPDRTPTVEGVARYGAVRLFVDRARSRLPTFELTRENAEASVRVCRRLEGIPLAIELATARMGALAVEQVAERLEDSLKLLSSTGGHRRTAPPRHQTLRATLDWSYGLLPQKERELFGRLSAFVGGWTLAAAEAVGAGGGIEEGEVLDLLGRLVDKSLVMAETIGEGAPRYRLLEPVRQYGRERLEESGEMERVRERHAGYYLGLAEAADLEPVGPEQLAWLERLEPEEGNLRAALSWYLPEEEAARSKESAQMGLRLATALGQFWEAYAPGEGRRWLERGLARSGASPKPLRARALLVTGFIVIWEGSPRALEMFAESLSLYKELGDRSGMALSIMRLGNAAAQMLDLERMRTLREEAEALLREPLEDRRERAHLLMFLGMDALSERDFERVEASFEEALALLRELGDVREVAQCLTCLGITALGRGDSERAAALFEEDLRLLRGLRSKVGTAYGLLGMAGVAASCGQPARAARLLGASEALQEVIRLPITPLHAISYDHEGYVAVARAGLNEAAFEAAWSEGRAMSPEQAIEYALLEEERDPPSSPTPALVPVAEQQPPPAEEERRGGLSGRQWEVALLVGRGLTNRQISVELSVSERTIHNHVRNILKKLGFRSRAQLAAWVGERRPRPSEGS